MPRGRTPEPDENRFRRGVVPNSVRRAVRPVSNLASGLRRPRAPRPGERRDGGAGPPAPPSRSPRRGAVRPGGRVEDGVVQGVGGGRGAGEAAQAADQGGRQAAHVQAGGGHQPGVQPDRPTGGRRTTGPGPASGGPIRGPCPAAAAPGPVSPGRTRRRSAYPGRARLKGPANSGRSGRGPARLMSPARTFHSCGSPSMWSRRRTRPTGVTRGLHRGPPAASHRSGMVRSLRIRNGRPARPRRVCV